MNNVIRIHPLMQLVCHICLVSLWTYWAISIGHINDGVWGWIALIVVGLGLLVGGAYCLIMESDVSEGDDDDMHFFFYGIISMIPLGIILYNYIISSTSSYLFLGLYIGIFLLLYSFKSFSAGILLFVLTIIPTYLLCSFTKWHDYIIVGVITLVGIFMSFVTAGKTVTNSSDLNDSDERFLLLFCFFGWILYSIGTAYFLMGNQILNHDWLTLPYIFFLVLLALCATSRIVTVILGVIVSVVYLFINWNTIFFDLIKNWFGSLWERIVDGIKWIYAWIENIWIENIWFQWTVYSIIGILFIISAIFFISRLYETKIVYREREHLLPMKYNGLSMTCPYCRKTMVTGKYNQSDVRGVIKTTTKGAIGGASVIGAFWAGAAVGGPFAPITGAIAALGAGTLNYYNNKNIDKVVDWAIDKWDYEMDGGRTVYFRCPRHECGHTWEETEHYGEIDH